MFIAYGIKPNLEPRRGGICITLYVAPTELKRLFDCAFYKHIVPTELKMQNRV